MPSLEFKGKAIIETHHHLVPHHRLEFDPKLSELPKGQKPGLDGNLIIEGDNLLALKALLPTHAGKIKCIYIDPPYNTGNEGWVYNDNLTQPQFKEWIGQTVGKEGEDSTRHDKWCCMMYPRLALLHQLLRDDGVLFVSIDDTEAHRLKCLLDEVFGEENIVATLARQTRVSPDSDEHFITATHDSVLVAAKNKNVLAPFRLARTEDQDARYDNPDNDSRGPWTSSDLTRREYREHDYYEIELPSGRKVKPAQGRSWGVPRESFSRLVSEGRIWFGPNGDAMPRLKRFLADIRGGVVPVTWWDKEIGGTNEEGRREVNRIFSERPDAFQNPKPVRLVSKLLSLCTDKESIVLDSTAGSGTTGHAVLDLNKVDGGNRSFILVQQPYDTKDDEAKQFNICQSITAERVRRVIRGYTGKKNGGKPEKAPGLGGSFGYVRVGEPLFGEYRDFGKRPPDFETLARYIFYTETSREIDLKKIDMKSGYLGEMSGNGGTSYYLFYAPGADKGNEFSMNELKRIVKTDKSRNLVVYCEKYWVHEDDLGGFEAEHGVRVRPMVIPFQLQ